MLEVTSDKFEDIEVGGLEGCVVMFLVSEDNAIISTFQDVLIRYGTAIDIRCKVLESCFSGSSRLYMADPFLFPNGFWDKFVEIGLFDHIPEHPPYHSGEGFNMDE